MEHTETELQAWRDRQPYVAELAAKAPENFGITTRDVIRPEGAHDIHMLFFVTTPQDKFTLRIYDSQVSLDHVRSEIFLLIKLRKGGFSVPEPIKAQDGSYISQVSLDGSNDPRYCVMYRWIDGIRLADIPIAERSPDLAHRLGLELARLHTFTETLNIPAWFTAPRRDLKRLKAFIQKQRDRHAPFKILRNLENVASLFESLNEHPNAFGLTHNDLNKGNILIHADTITFLDFTHFGWGFYINDVAKIIDFGVAKSNENELLRGYTEIRDLPDDTTTVLGNFRVARKPLRVLHWNWF